MAKLGIIKTIAGGYFDMGDGTYIRNASRWEVLEDTIAGRNVYYVTQIESMGLISTDKENWTVDSSALQDGATTTVYAGSTIDGFIASQFGPSATVTWEQPLTEVTAA